MYASDPALHLCGEVEANVRTIIESTDDVRRDLFIRVLWYV